MLNRKNTVQNTVEPSLSVGSKSTDSTNHRSKQIFFNSRKLHKAKLEFGAPIAAHIAHLHGPYNYLPLIYIAFGITRNLDV